MKLFVLLSLPTVCFGVSLRRCLRRLGVPADGRVHYVSPFNVKERRLLRGLSERKCEVRVELGNQWHLLLSLKDSDGQQQVRLRRVMQTRQNVRSYEVGLFKGLDQIRRRGCI